METITRLQGQSAGDVDCEVIWEKVQSTPSGSEGTKMVSMGSWTVMTRDSKCEDESMIEGESGRTSESSAIPRVDGARFAILGQVERDSKIDEEGKV